MNILDEDIKSLEQYATSPAYQTIQAARLALNANFTWQNCRNVVMMTANLHMQIACADEVDEWIRKNPPPQIRRTNRDGLRIAGQIAGIAMNYAGVSGGNYVQMGTQVAASALEQRDAAMRITGVRDGSAAHQAGLQPDDIILVINGKRLATLQDYSDAVNDATGQKMVLIAHKGDSKKNIEFTLVFSETE